MGFKVFFENKKIGEDVVKLYGVQDDKNNIVIPAQYEVYKEGDENTFVFGTKEVEGGFIKNPVYYKYNDYIMVKLKLDPWYNSYGKPFENGFTITCNSSFKQALVNLNGTVVTKPLYNNIMLLDDVDAIKKYVNVLGAKVLYWVKPEVFNSRENIESFKECLRNYLKDINVTHLTEDDFTRLIKKEYNLFNRICKEKQGILFVEEAKGNRAKYIKLIDEIVK